MAVSVVAAVVAAAVAGETLVVLLGSLVEPPSRVGYRNTPGDAAVAVDGLVALGWGLMEPSRVGSSRGLLVAHALHVGSRGMLEGLEGRTRMGRWAFVGADRGGPDRRCSLLGRGNSSKRRGWLCRSSPATFPLLSIPLWEKVGSSIVFLLLSTVSWITLRLLVHGGKRCTRVPGVVASGTCTRIAVHRFSSRTTASAVVSGGT